MQFQIIPKLGSPKKQVEQDQLHHFFQILCNFQIYLEMVRNHQKNIFYLGRGCFFCILGPYLSSKNMKIITFSPLLVTYGHHRVLTQDYLPWYDQGGSNVQFAR